MEPVGAHQDTRAAWVGTDRHVAVQEAPAVACGYAGSLSDVGPGRVALRYLERPPCRVVGVLSYGHGRGQGRRSMTRFTRAR